MPYRNEDTIKKVKEFIDNYWRAHTAAPTVADIRNACDIHTTWGTAMILAVLKERGHLESVDPITPKWVKEAIKECDDEPHS